MALKSKQTIFQKNKIKKKKPYSPTIWFFFPFKFIGDGIILSLKLTVELIDKLLTVFKKNSKQLRKNTVNDFRLVKKNLYSLIRLKTRREDRKKFDAFSKTIIQFVPLKKRKRQLFLSFALGIILTLLFIFIPYNIYLFIKFLPNPKLLSERTIPVTTQIFDRNGKLLYEIHADEDRQPIPFEKIPEKIKQATISIEDKEFYFHPGFSIRGISRALRENVMSNNVQGGSTITQQLIKNALLNSQVTISRKVREIVLAFWAERIYTKNEILEMYLNQVPYGGTAWGIEAAAKRYFDKSIEDLNLAEITYLAGLPAAPTLYSPYGTRPDLGKKRQLEVLRRMVEDHYITEKESQEAQDQELNIKPEFTSIRAPHFVMYIRKLLSQKLGTRLVEQGGLRITTTLDLDLQEKAQDIVTDEIGKLERLQVGNGAALVTNPKTGEILAMVGSKDYFDEKNDGNVNVTLAPRQPGSSIKVINYASALRNGFTAATLINDSAVSYPQAGTRPYQPVNYDGKFHGMVTFRSALANSYNIPAVKILNTTGIEKMVTLARKMGITTWDDPSRFGLSLTLGGVEVTMHDMAQVYGTLANLGEQVTLNPILEVKDFSGKVYIQNKKEVNQALEPEVAYIISDILADNVARTPAFGPNSQLVIPGKPHVAVKTGTTNEKRDNWTIGYTPAYVVVVWVGNNDNRPMNPILTSGVTGASPIWNRIMTEIIKDRTDEWYPLPENVIGIPCFGKTEYFIKGTQPKGGCVAPSIKPQTSPNPSEKNNQ